MEVNQDASSATLPSGEIAAMTESHSSAEEYDANPLQLGTSNNSITDDGKVERSETNRTEKIRSNAANDATTQKILRFWNHPSLQDVSPTQKQEYLKHKGITEDQIFSAWDQIMETQNQTQSKPQQGNNEKNIRSSNDDWVSSFSSQQQQQQQQQQPISSYSNHNNTNAAGAHRPYPPPYDDFLDNEEDDRTPNVALIATIGGFLGLMAAATVRWLNGGDFLLFPPPSRASSGKMEDSQASRVLTLKKTSHNPQSLSMNSNIPMEEDQAEGDEEEEDEDDEEDEDEDADLDRYLSSPPSLTPRHSDAELVQQAMAQLTETFQQHVSVQQRILQKLSTNNSNSGVTDLSMQALRKHHHQTKTIGHDANVSTTATTTTPDPMLWYKLVEIQVELTTLKRDWNGNNEELEKRLGETLQQLKTVLAEFQLLKPNAMAESSDDATTRTEDRKQQNSTVENSPTHTISTASLEEEDAEAVEKDASPKEDITDLASPSASEATATASTPDANLTTTISPVAAPAEQEEHKSQILREVRKAIIDLVRENKGNPPSAQGRNSNTLPVCEQSLQKPSRSAI